MYFNSQWSVMEITHTETNRGNTAIIVDGVLHRKFIILKNEL